MIKDCNSFNYLGYIITNASEPDKPALLFKQGIYIQSHSYFEEFEGWHPFYSEAFVYGNTGQGSEFERDPPQFFINHRRELSSLKPTDLNHFFLFEPVENEVFVFDSPWIKDTEKYNFQYAQSVLQNGILSDWSSHPSYKELLGRTNNGLVNWQKCLTARNRQQNILKAKFADTDSGSSHDKEESSFSGYFISNQAEKNLPALISDEGILILSHPDRQQIGRHYFYSEAFVFGNTTKEGADIIKNNQDPLPFFQYKSFPPSSDSFQSKDYFYFYDAVANKFYVFDSPLVEDTDGLDLTLYEKEYPLASCCDTEEYHKLRQLSDKGKKNLKDNLERIDVPITDIKQLHQKSWGVCGFAACIQAAYFNGNVAVNAGKNYKTFRDMMNGFIQNLTQNHALESELEDYNEFAGNEGILCADVYTWAIEENNFFWLTPNAIVALMQQLKCLKASVAGQGGKSIKNIASNYTIRNAIYGIGYTPEKWNEVYGFAGIKYNPRWLPIVHWVYFNNDGHVLTYGKDYSLEDYLAECPYTEIWTIVKLS